MQSVYLAVLTLCVVLAVMIGHEMGRRKERALIDKIEVTCPKPKLKQISLTYAGVEGGMLLLDCASCKVVSAREPLVQQAGVAQ